MENEEILYEVVNLDASKFVKQQMYQQKLLKRMPTSVQTLFTQQLMRLSIKMKARGCDSCFYVVMNTIAGQ